MDRYVVLNDLHQVLLCRLCNSAVRPGAGIDGHFRRNHRLKGEALRQIKDYFGEMPLNDPAAIDNPDDGSSRIDTLELLQGFSCSRCRYLSTARDNITRHWKEAGHSGMPQCTRVQLHTWLRGKYTRYWMVGTGVEERSEALAPAENDAFEKMLAECNDELKEEDTARLRNGELEEGIDRDSTWVKDMKWVKHFGSRNRIAIFDATEWVRSRSAKAKRNEVEESEDALRERICLTRLGESFDREVERCCWRLESVPKETLQWLGSISPERPSGKPFGRTAIESSMTKYRSLGHRYLSFCWRAYHLGREDANERLAAQFTDEQWSLLQDVIYELEEAGPDEKAGDQNDNMEDSEDSEDSEEEYFHDRGWYDESAEQMYADSPSGRGNGETAVMPYRALDRAVYLFMVASIKVRVGGNVYKNGLLSFCAALGIRKEPLGYTEAFLYTGLVAAALWWARVFFLEAAFEEQTRELFDLGPEPVLAFREEHAKWMCAGSHTVVSTMINWLAYGKGHRHNLGGQPSIRWSEDGESLFHHGEQLSIRNFKRTSMSMIAEADGLLNKLFGGKWDSIGPNIDMDRIADDLVRIGAGQSFATNPKNDWLGAGPQKVMRAMKSSLWDEMRSRWKKSAIKRWLKWLRQFRELAMVIVHIFGGLPGRGPEVMTLRHCDTWQLIRNIFVWDGQVMIITDRDKMKAIRDNGRKVARFLPDRPGRMMAAYIAWLLPAERALLRLGKLPAPRPDSLEYLWRDGSSKRWETDRLSLVMARIMQAGTGMRIGVGRYRTIAIEMGRKVRGLVLRQMEQAAGDDDEEDHIEVDPITGEAMDVSGSWNIVWDLQSTHGTAMARKHYAVHIGFPGRLPPELIMTYREISKLWHQFLASGEASQTGVRGKKRKAGSNMETSQSGHNKRCKTQEAQAQGRDLEEEVITGLRQLLGPTSTWRSIKQKESMMTIMALKGEETAISVLPTGAGKSILFMLPAVMRDTGTSIVVVPFTALIEDLVGRATKMGVDCIQFVTAINMEREILPRAARLVVVSADVVTSDGFSAYMDGLRAADLLQRIFVDECHTIMTDIEYRVKLEGLRSLRRYQCPIISLTATLPVLLEVSYRDAMLVDSAIMIRDRTTKLNCRYRVKQVKAGAQSIEDETVKTVQRIGARMLSGQKGVVYCRSKAQCDILAEEIGCGKHHGDMSEDQRREARMAWTEGSSHRWIVATTGLGTGIDIEGVMAVIHAGQPYGLIDFVQQTGRGGRRAGEVVESIIIHDGRRPWQDAHSNFIAKNNQAQMEAFVNSPSCRRSVLSSFMDGVGGETCMNITGAEYCDRCGKVEECRDGAETLDGDDVMETGNEASGDNDERGGIWQRFNKEEGRKIRVLFRWLDEVLDECPPCHVRKHFGREPGQRIISGEYRHEGSGEWCEDVAVEPYKKVRKKMKFASNTCCFTCKLPADWCEETKETVGEEMKCKYMDKVLPVALLPIRSVRVRRLAQERFDIDIDDREGYYKWLAQKRRFHGTNGTNMHALWEVIIWEAYKGGTVGLGMRL